MIIPMDISVDCVIFGFDDEDDQLKVLLIEQKKLSKKMITRMALPGDLVHDDECFETAAERVLKELTQMSGLFLQQFKAFGDPNRVKAKKDQEWLVGYRENPQRRVATLGYYSLVRMEDYQPFPSSFAAKTEWISIQDVPKMELAFDHNIIFEEGLKALRNDFEQEVFASELLPKKFTLGQLQRLHEIILRKKLDKRNFRKNLKKMDELVPLNEKQKNVNHKPAQLYKFDLGGD